MNQNLVAPAYPRPRFRAWFLAIVTLLLSALLVSPAYGRQYSSAGAGNRAYRKAAKKARKDMQRYQKQQQKATKQSAKAQRKALNRARRNQSTY